MIANLSFLISDYGCGKYISCPYFISNFQRKCNQICFFFVFIFPVLSYSDSSQSASYILTMSSKIIRGK